jgi:UDP-perosamine 4-acetyltransferase
MTGSTSRLPLLLIGAGGHAKVAAEIAVQNEAFDLVGFIDQHPVGTLVNGVPVVGSDEHLPSLWDKGIRHIHVAIGNNLLRSRLGQQVSNLGFTLSTLISPAACISPSAHLGHGSVIMAGAILNAEATIGDLTIINTNASVDHECKIGRVVHIAAGCVLAGNVTIGDRSFIGAGATIIPGVTLGDDVIVGAGACVVRDVPSGQRVVGVPAR